ncbi:MAG TPA: carbonic anhydrase [Rhabdochlamydiaceae bacterium]|nr:carbonic anhydrase [Rhabdochlamydiaceae bacterium]
MKIRSVLSFIFVIACTSSVFSQDALLQPDQALKKLQDGNQRFVSGNFMHPDQSSRRRAELERREDLVAGQEPFAVIVSCSDSRVPPEIIFDQGLGDLFVARVAGNVVGPLEMDSIEFSADILKSSLILVLGHENCGAVNATLLGQAAPNHMSHVAPYLQSAVDKTKNMPGSRLVNAIKANVQNVMRQLEGSPVLSPLIRDNKLKIIGAYYHLNSGKVELLQP